MAEQCPTNSQAGNRPGVHRNKIDKKSLFAYISPISSIRRKTFLPNLFYLIFAACQEKLKLTEPQAGASETRRKAKPLAGVRVIEMGQLLAGPFCGRILAEFGAEVIKIEAPIKGDPLRVWRAVVPETKTSLWWYVQSRNKKSVTLDMNQQPVASEIVRQLVAKADVLVENFKPGTMEKWGLGWDELHAAFPVW